jgi:putative phosphoribosyl transferase
MGAPGGSIGDAGTDLSGHRGAGAVDSVARGRLLEIMAGAPGRSGEPRIGRAAIDPVARVPVDGVTLEGDLHAPAPGGPAVLVVADAARPRQQTGLGRALPPLWDAGLGTLHLDLLTDAERVQWGVFRGEVHLQAARIAGALRWLSSTGGAGRVGVMADGIPAAAALVAAQSFPQSFGGLGALVLLDARTDIAGPNGSLVLAPALLLIGDAQPKLLASNKQWLAMFGAERHRMGILPGVGDLLADPAALDEATRRAAAWLAHHLDA